MDFAGDNLPDLKKMIEEKYPGVKVTTIQADAADETAISSVCRQALEEEGKLDIFFANVLHSLPFATKSLTEITFRPVWLRLTI